MSGSLKIQQSANTATPEAGFTTIYAKTDGYMYAKFPDGNEQKISPGVTGAKGDTGPTGDQGPQGDQGIQGDIGVTGAKGDIGPTGDQGQQGDQGIQGVQGDTGPTGDQGIKGDTGDVGPTGAQGDIGPEGAQGDTGPTGATGDDGKDGDIFSDCSSTDSETLPITIGSTVNMTFGIDLAYTPGQPVIVSADASNLFNGLVLTYDKNTGATTLEVVSNLGTGTYNSWCINLEGAQGPQGEKGDTGDIGPTGPTGNDGADGNDGPTGPKGDTGDIGPQGNDGAPGPTGATGPVGSDGAPGPTGATGATGEAGVWGSITGTLSDQTDLQTELDKKMETVVAGNNISINSIDPFNPIITSTTSTSAGSIHRVWFTGDEETTTEGTFYLSNGGGKGTVASALQTVNVDDDEKLYFGEDVLGATVTDVTKIPKGTYSSFLSVEADDDKAQHEFTIEIYLSDPQGTPVDSPDVTQPVGDLGFRVLAILSSGLTEFKKDEIKQINLSGPIPNDIEEVIGQRIRYHVSGAKIGAGGEVVKLTLYYGSDYNSYLDAPVTGITEFIGLLDTPANYTGQGGKLAAVNPGEDALEFIDPSGGGELQPGTGVNSLYTPNVGGIDPEGLNSIAIGNLAKAETDKSVAIGYDATAKDGSISIGDGSESQAGSISMGIGARTSWVSQIAIGGNSYSGGANGICIGNLTTDNNKVSSVAIGYNASGNHDGSTVLGHDLTSVVSESAHVDGLHIKTAPEYADSPAAITAGLTAGQVFRDSSGHMQIVAEGTVGGAQTDFVKNNTDTYVSHPDINQMISLTQAEYDAIGTPNVSTMYVII